MRVRFSTGHDVHAFRVGDRVVMQGVDGYVIERSLLVTRVKTPKNEVITVPNSLVLGGQVTNYSEAARGEGVILHTTVTIGYDSSQPDSQTGRPTSQTDRPVG